jgi:hypothetical protein
MRRVRWSPAVAAALAAAVLVMRPVAARAQAASRSFVLLPERVALAARPGDGRMAPWSSALSTANALPWDSPSRTTRMVWGGILGGILGYYLMGPFVCFLAMPYRDGPLSHRAARDCHYLGIAIGVVSGAIVSDRMYPAP